MKHQFALVFLAGLALPAFAADALASRQIVKLTDSPVLFELLPELKMADCQPIKGEHVQVGEQQASIGTPSNVRVTVIEGRCAGKVGYVGLAHLQPVP